MEVILKLETSEALQTIANGALQNFIEAVDDSNQKVAMKATPKAEQRPAEEPIAQAPVTAVDTGTGTIVGDPQPSVQETVPTQEHTYTADELAKAGVSLMDMGKQTELINALRGFGVGSLPELQPHQYGEFAMKLRELGAQI